MNDEGAASVPRLSNTDQEGENSSFKTRVPRPSSEDPEGHEHKDVSRSSNDGTYKSPYAQKEIAGAIWNISKGNSDNQLAIRKAGGIPKLIGLLVADAVIHRNAAGALWSLADDLENARLIANQDGITPLVALITKGGGRAQDTAAGALYGMAKLEENRTAIADAGAIGPLVGIFDGGNAEAVEHSAGALTTLTLNNPANQESVSAKLVGDAQEGLC